MKVFRKIDQDGFFIRDELFDKQPTITEVQVDEEGNDIEVEVNDPSYIAEKPEKLHRPKWDGEEWIEGLTPEELDEIAARPTPLSESDMLMMAMADLDAQREADKLEQQLAMAELAEMLMGGSL